MSVDATHIAKDFRMLMKEDLNPLNRDRVAENELQDELNELNKDPKQLAAVLKELHKATDIKVTEIKDTSGNITGIEYCDPYGAQKREMLRDSRILYSSDCERLDILSVKDQEKVKSMVKTIESGDKQAIEKLFKSFSNDHESLSRLLTPVNLELKKHDSKYDISAGIGEKVAVSVRHSQTNKVFYVEF